MNVLIVGGSGNISGEITNLFVSNNHDVTIINRGNRMLNPKAKVILCDISNKEEYYSKIKDLSFDVVIDMICYTLDDAKFDYENYKTRCKHLIVCSSVAAYKRPFNSSIIHSDSPLLDTPEFDYGFRKANIERFLLEKKDEMNITIIRPSLTFGVGCKNIGVLRQNYNIIDRILNNKPLISFGEGLNPFTFSFAPDVANGFYLSALNPNTYGKAYHITNDEFMYFDDLYKEIANYLHKDVTIYHLPSELLVEYNKEVFDHIYLEKRHLGYFSSEEFKKDVPNFNINYHLEDGVKLIVDYLMKDKIIDKEKYNIEDDICNKYLAIKDILLK